VRIGVLTSSRADYGIYRPLLYRIKEENRYDIKIIVFGTHLSRFHGYTINRIREDGFAITEQLETLILGDTEEAISNAIGNTITKFSSLWEKLKNDIDLVFALGDRYEMFAAVVASVPFNIKIAHIHGGETTLGAIDNKFRHSLSLMSMFHFVATKEYAERVSKSIGSSKLIFVVGALSLDNILSMKILSKDALKEQFMVDLSKPSILTTFHPESVAVSKNEQYGEELVKTFEELSKYYQIIITLPNADTMGTLLRQIFTNLSSLNPNIFCVENFGTLGYYSCITYCDLLLGNTSSGIIEAASFGKYVINVGDRQKGRARSKNVIDVSVEREAILDAVKTVSSLGFQYKGENTYISKEPSSVQILNVLDQLDE